MVDIPINPSQKKEITFEWVASYNDGTEISQFDDALGIERHINDIDLSKISKLHLVSRTHSGPELAVDLTTGQFTLDGEIIKGVETKLSKSDIIETSLGNKLRVICYRRIQRDGQLTEDNITKMAMVETGLRQMYHFIGWEAWVNGEYQRHEVALTHQGQLYIPKKEKAISLF
jgi:hypothetical protein